MSTDIRFDETATGVWLKEVVQDCLRELPGGQSGVEMNLLVQKVRAEPENAQTAMQLLAQQLEAEFKNRPVSQAEGIDQSLRLLLGSLYSAYLLYRHLDNGHPLDQAPPELNQTLRRYPLILECFQSVSSESD